VADEGAAEGDTGARRRGGLRDARRVELHPGDGAVARDTPQSSSTTKSKENAKGRQSGERPNRKTPGQCRRPRRPRHLANHSEDDQEAERQATEM
jgi:hypothetical protein